MYKYSFPLIMKLRISDRNKVNSTLHSLQLVEIFLDNSIVSIILYSSILKLLPTKAQINTLFNTDTNLITYLNCIAK